METLEKKTNPGWGGARDGGGRPKGSGNKLSGKDILEAIFDSNDGVPYEVILANDFLQARHDGDRHLVVKYHQLILNKVIADRVDITSNGETIQVPTLNFTPKEIPDYIDAEVKRLQ
jgi:hypothetical protein